MIKGGCFSWGNDIRRRNPPLPERSSAVFTQLAYVWPLANEPLRQSRGKLGLKLMVHAPGKSAGGLPGVGVWELQPLNIRKKLGKQFNTLPVGHSVDSFSGLCACRRELFTDPEIVAKYSHYPQLLK